MATVPYYKKSDSSYYEKSDRPGNDAVASAFQAGMARSGRKTQADKKPKDKKDKKGDGKQTRVDTDMTGGIPMGSAKALTPGGQGKHGGRVKKTAAYVLHKGEEVVPARKLRGKAAKRKRTARKG